MRFSLKSLKSGIRCYRAFIGAVLHVLRWELWCAPFVACFADHCFPGTKSYQYFPPSIDTLMAWSTLFRSGRTFRNYLNYVKVGCIMCNASCQVGACRRGACTGA